MNRVGVKANLGDDNDKKKPSARKQHCGTASTKTLHSARRTRDLVACKQRTPLPPTLALPLHEKQNSCLGVLDFRISSVVVEAF